MNYLQKVIIIIIEISQKYVSELNNKYIIQNKTKSSLLKEYTFEYIVGTLGYIVVAVE